MSVTWVQNGSSKHEISSKEHLLQLMHRGTLYTDAGSPPPNYWDGDYQQTADIDLALDTSISPIGSSAGSFTGSYDGGTFSIKNWSFTGSEPNVGLFGVVSGATLANIRLGGVWVISEASTSAGFVVGSASSSTLRNIECTFDEGTAVTDTSISRFGAIAGIVSGNSYALTVRGTIDLATSTNGDHGGIFGLAGGPNHVGLRNAAVWTNGLSGSVVGGVIGELSFDTNVTYAVNVMVGDITGSICGGIAGYNGRGGGHHPFSVVVNSMRGSISGTTYAGGIIGQTFCRFGSIDVLDAVNYMTGDITATNSVSGGIFGYVSRSASHGCSLSNSIVAMNGTVDDATFGSITFTPTASARIMGGFGLFTTTASYGSATDTFVGTNSPAFPDLDYIPLTFTDDASVSYEYEFVFGNVGGSPSYQQYSHAIVFKQNIAGPYFIDFDLANNTTEYLTYIATGDYVSALIDDSLTVLDSSAPVVFAYDGVTVLFGEIPTDINLEVGAIDVTVTITPIPDADKYQLQYAPTAGGSTVVAYTDFGELKKTIFGLQPEVEYAISLLFTPVGSSTYELGDSKTVTTLPNEVASYNLMPYGDAGVYDLSPVGDLANISQVMNGLFSSGDTLSVDVGTPLQTTFLGLGGDIPLQDGALLVPFVPINGPGQTITLTLSDNTPETVAYDESSGSIIVGGATYSDGDVILLDGKRITVLDV